MGNPWVRRQLPKSHPRVSARVRATKFHILLFLPGDIFDASLLQIGPYWWSRGLESNLHEFTNYRLHLNRAASSNNAATAPPSSIATTHNHASITRARM